MPSKEQLAALQAQIEKTKANIAATEAQAAAIKKQTAAERTAAVTAARLASSPIAQQAVKTTAALKSFTAKGGILGVSGSNIPGNTGDKTPQVFSFTDPNTGETMQFGSQAELVAYINSKGSSKSKTGVTGATGATGVAKTAINTQMITVNGKQVMVTTWSDGTTTQTDYGSTVNQDNAITNLTSMFAAYGLGGNFANAIKDMVVKGYTADTISLIAQDPNSTNPLAVAFQARFAGNAARIKAGMAPLSPAEYIATERSYRQIMQAAGLPKGFYDSNSDFTSFIAKDVSPTEIKSRVDAAAESIANADPFYKSSLMSMYGLSTGDMIAHALDPQMALPLLQKQAEAVKIGTAASRQGWGISATGAENLYAQGVTAAQAAQGFKSVAGMQTEQQRLAEIWGGDTAAQGQNLVAATFGTAGAAYADQQIKALQQKEINAFSGGSGIAKGSLGIGTEQTGGNL